MTTAPLARLVALDLPLPWPFEREYMQLALVAGLVVGLTAPLMGTFMVQRRMSLMGDGIGHLAFAGVAGGVLLGIWPVWSALAVAVVGALVVEHLRSRGAASGDLALAIFFYGGIAAGVVLVSLAGSLDANLFTYLFGSILTVGPDEVWVVVSGEGKAEAVARALSGAEPRELPAAGVHGTRGTRWLLDAAAASKLPGTPG